MKKIIFEKKQLRLKEEEQQTINVDANQENDTSNNKQVTVDPVSSKNGALNLASDLNTARTEHPTANTLTFNGSTYAPKNVSRAPVSMNVSANSPQQAARAYSQQLASNPQAQQAANNGNLNVKVNLTQNGNQNGQPINSGVMSRPVIEGINFTKKELDNFLINL